VKPLKRTKKAFDAAALFAGFRKLKWDAAGPMTWNFSFRYREGTPIVRTTAAALEIVAATLRGPPERVWPVRYAPDAAPADQRFTCIQFAAVMSESALARLHAAFEALARKHAIDYGGVIAFPAEADSGQPAMPAPSMKLDAAALFAHLRNNIEHRPKARQFRQLWSFSFCHQDFQHLCGVAEELLDCMIATLGRKPKKLEPSLAETQRLIDERGNKTDGPPVAEIAFTDHLSEVDLTKLHAAFGALAQRQGITYEGVNAYAAPTRGWVRVPVAVVEPRARRPSPRKAEGLTPKKKAAKNSRQPRR
jgi:hypothetical protein